MIFPREPAPSADTLALEADSTFWTADALWDVETLPSDWVQRGPDEYAEAFAALLPRGPAWPRERETALMQLVAGMAAVWGHDVESRAAALLLRESDPRAAIDLLPDWERAWGLPDPCIAEALSVRDRQIALVSKMTMLGGQSISFFLSLAASIGYEVSIREYSPFMVGVSRVGDTRETGANGEAYRWEIGSPDMRSYWTVRVGATRFSWFRVGAGQVGVDPHLRIALATDLECLFRRYKPAHTEVFFDYSGLGTPDPMAGTP